jgi:gamma-glutamyl-gamma-aminobutyrate hydrolase PuuD
MYNEHRHPKTYFNSRRDDQDFAVARYAMKHNIPLAGICRGGQFLNVLNKGSMWQDVSGHALNAKHMMRDHWNDIKLPVTSTHHQMMMPGANGLIIGTAIESERRERVNKKIPGSIHTNIIRTREHLTWSDSDVDQDIEIVWYPDTDSLCYQPHPEFKGEIELRNHYFLLLEQLFYDTLDIKKVSNDK